MAMAISLLDTALDFREGVDVNYSRCTRERPARSRKEVSKDVGRFAESCAIM
jgi:hypothetical protein